MSGGDARKNGGSFHLRLVYTWPSLDSSSGCFASSGPALLSSPQVWAWEPITCYDAVDLHWQNVSDMHIHEVWPARTGRWDSWFLPFARGGFSFCWLHGASPVQRSGELYGVSFVESFVSIWNVRLQQLHPFSQDPTPSRGSEPPRVSEAPARSPAPAQSARPVPPEYYREYHVCFCFWACHVPHMALLCT